MAPYMADLLPYGIDRVQVADRFCEHCRAPAMAPQALWCTDCFVDAFKWMLARGISLAGRSYCCGATLRWNIYGCMVYCQKCGHAAHARAAE